MSFQSLSPEQRALSMRIAGYVTTAATPLFKLPNLAIYAEPEALAVLVGRHYDEANRLANKVMAGLEASNAATYRTMFAPNAGTLRAYVWLVIALLSIKLESGWAPRDGRQFPPAWDDRPQRPTTAPPAPAPAPMSAADLPDEDDAPGVEEIIEAQDVADLPDEELLGLVREAYMQYVSEGGAEASA